jgi:hypothetical protein
MGEIIEHLAISPTPDSTRTQHMFSMREPRRAIRAISERAIHESPDGLVPSMSFWRWDVQHHLDNEEPLALLT